MKRTILLCIIFLSVAFTQSISAQSVRLMTYNIRYATDNDKENSWENRKESMVKLLQHYQPEIFGIQEGLNHQIEYLKLNLKNYQYIGVGRDDGKTMGEYSAIFYDTTLFDVTMQNTYWLSESPHTVSLGWGANYHRVCTYGLFTHQPTGHKFWVFNTHFDHQSVLAREESAKLILKKIEAVNSDKLPVILMGDFNATPESQPVAIIRKKLSDAFYKTQKPHYGPIGTFTGFDPNMTPLGRIDYIFVKGFEVNSIVHIDDKRADNFFVSDHLPVLVEVQF